MEEEKVKLFIFSSKDTINLPTTPHSISFTAGDFTQLIEDCDLVQNIYVFNLRYIIQDLTNYSVNLSDTTKQELAYQVIDVVSPFIKVTQAIAAFGIFYSDNLAPHNKYYDKTFYIRSDLENNFISQLSKEDQITFNSVVQMYNDKQYADDENVLVDLYQQGDILYEITI